MAPRRPSRGARPISTLSLAATASLYAAATQLCFAGSWRHGQWVSAPAWRRLRPARANGCDAAQLWDGLYDNPQKQKGEHEQSAGERVLAFGKEYDFEPGVWQEPREQVGFGKYSSRTYEEALKEDHDYCRWVVDQAAESRDQDEPIALVKFAEWLREQGVEPSNGGAYRSNLPLPPSSPGLSPPDLDASALQSAGEGADATLALRNDESGRMEPAVVSFGKLDGCTYEEALSRDPDYCDWVLRQLDRDDEEPSESLGKFAEWLKENWIRDTSLQESIRVGFGRHADLTYQEALQQHPDYCDWVADRAAKDDDCHSKLREFADWLRKERDSDSGGLDGTMEVGKYKGMLFSEIIASDPGYSEWVCRRASSGDASLALMRFAAYLQKHQPEVCQAR